MNRLLPVLMLVITAVLIAAGTAPTREKERTTSPEGTVQAFYNRVKADDYRGAYSLIAPSSNVDFSDLYHDVAGRELFPVAAFELPPGRGEAIHRHSEILSVEPSSDLRIAGKAGLSTEAFHAHFRNRRECFLALLDEFAAESLEEARDLWKTAPSWPQAVHRAIGAYVEHLLAHPELTRIAFAELFALGPAIAHRLTGSVDGLVDLLAQGAPAPRHGSAVLQETLTGPAW